MFKGFTLIELLITISIITVLASFGIFTFGGAQKKGRDAQRKNDIKQYQIATLALASKNKGFYPLESTTVSADDAVAGLCFDIGLAGCPSDPKESTDATYDYKYQSDGAGATGAATATKYVLWAKIENTTDYWVVCSNGKSGTLPQAGFTVAGGVCPLP